MLVPASGALTVRLQHRAAKQNHTIAAPSALRNGDTYAIEMFLPYKFEDFITDDSNHLLVSTKESENTYLRACWHVFSKTVEMKFPQKAKTSFRKRAKKSVLKRAKNYS